MISAFSRISITKMSRPEVHLFSLRSFLFSSFYNDEVSAFCRKARTREESIFSPLTPIHSLLLSSIFLSSLSHHHLLNMAVQFLAGAAALIVSLFDKFMIMCLWLHIYPGTAVHCWGTDDSNAGARWAQHQGERSSTLLRETTQLIPPNLISISAEARRTSTGFCECRAVLHLWLKLHPRWQCSGWDSREIQQELWLIRSSQMTAIAIFKSL